MNIIKGCLYLDKKRYEMSKNINEKDLEIKDRILFETHKKENIDLLKLRDFYFDKSRNLHFIRVLVQIIPTVLLVVSYLPYFSKMKVVSDYRDYVAGGLAILSFLLMNLIQAKIDQYMGVSNTYREEYDVKVFGLKRNEYLYDYSCLNNYQEKADKIIKNDDKYEYWYEEIFCNDNHYNNVVCCQMDNVIYTYHVYTDTRKHYTVGLIGFLMLMSLFWYLIGKASFFFISILTIFDILQLFIEYIFSSKELAEKNKHLMEKVQYDEKTEYSEDDVRFLQDYIVENRNQSLFIPKHIRKAYLKDGNRYYVDLDKVKNRLMKKEMTSVPSSADEIYVLSPDGKQIYRLSTIQQRLLDMFKEVVSVLDANNIQYTLDGGTLLGAVREKNKFLFWDDDIDIAIRNTDFEKAKQVLRKAFGDKYDFQDNESEEYYSPRLSSLRIREKGSSIINEKDSPLFDKYKMRGVFLDIYVYCPILCSRVIDYTFRQLFIHTLNRSIKKTEYLVNKSDKYLIAFKKKKAKYIKRVMWYEKHAKCEKYYSYIPYYIDNIKKPGPYIRTEDLYGNTKKNACNFEGVVCKVPVKPEKVLEACYGERWGKSPFNDVEKCLNDRKYSGKKFGITKLKHLSYYSLSEEN